MCFGKTAFSYSWFCVLQDKTETNIWHTFSVKEIKSYQLQKVSSLFI